jgi:hypothetical protein
LSIHIAEGREIIKPLFTLSHKGARTTVNLTHRNLQEGQASASELTNTFSKKLWFHDEISFVFTYLLVFETGFPCVVEPGFETRACLEFLIFLPLSPKSWASFVFR